MVLVGMFAVLDGVEVVSLCQMGVMGCCFVVAFVVMAGGFVVVARSVLVMFRCLGMMMGCLL